MSVSRRGGKPILRHGFLLTGQCNVETLIEHADTSTRLHRVDFEPCATIGASFTTKWGPMATFDDVVRLCADLPEVTVSTSHGTPALKVRAKGFCRSWGARDSSKANIGDVEVLVVFCELDEREFLLAESDGSIFTAPHYDGHGAVLVLLDATIIRALFVPSMVVLFGRLNWWMPRSLTRLLAVKPLISSRRLGNPDASEEALLRRSVRRIEERNA